MLKLKPPWNILCDQNNLINLDNDKVIVVVPAQDRAIYNSYYVAHLFFVALKSKSLCFISEEDLLEDPRLEIMDINS